MIRPAVVSRRLQFVAGPQSHTFHACEQHRADLEQPWYRGELFYPTKQWPVEPVPHGDEIDCDSCHAEDGP